MPRSDYSMNFFSRLSPPKKKAPARKCERAKINLFNDLSYFVDYALNTSCQIVSPSILIISTSKTHNFFDMDPFSARMPPNERSQSPLSFGGVLVSCRRVFENFWQFDENASEIFART